MTRLIQMVLLVDCDCYGSHSARAKHHVHDVLVVPAYGRVEGLPCDCLIIYVVSGSISGSFSTYHKMCNPCKSFMLPLVNLIVCHLKLPLSFISPDQFTTVHCEKVSGNFFIEASSSTQEWHTISLPRCSLRVLTDSR